MYIRYISIMYICMKDFAGRDYSDGFDQVLYFRNP